VQSYVRSVEKMSGQNSTNEQPEDVDIKMRDFFAAMAMIGIIYQGMHPESTGDLAYRYADEMVRARSK
jgi:hypothetical protein